LLDEVIAALAPREGALYVDATFGGGGTTRALLEAARCTVTAIDRDPDAVGRARALEARFGDRLEVIEGRFGELERLLGEHGVAEVDGGVVFDLGVSTPQLEEAGRGFSFAADGPLDMRMERTGPTAADVVNSAGEAELADILYRYGEERGARRVAAAIVAARSSRPLTRTAELAAIVRAALPRARRGIDPATRSFQALRIYVNDELGELGRGLSAAERVLAAGARLVVVSFHSLEDRLVKRFLAARARPAPRPSRHLPAPAAGDATAPAPSFHLLGRRAVRPSRAEVAANPRARSARLRAAERTAAAPWREAA
jgi:16S rRNA (cytosine1402-N4)-methyltransferase